MPQTGAQEVLRRVLSAARTELGMDVAWISRFESGRQVLTTVEGGVEQFGLADGSALSLNASYCTRVVAGELPPAIPDARADSTTAALPVTEALGIGSYAGVPIHLPTGEVYGMLCCVGRGPRPELSARGIRFLQLLAEAAAAEIVDNETELVGAAQRRSRVEAVLRDASLHVVAQPVVALSAMRTVGVEALARFPSGGPDVWFSDAEAAGLGVELELLAARRAIALLDELDAALYVAVNASPSALLDSRFGELVAGADTGRIVLEVTEHAGVHDYARLHEALTPLRSAGVRLAVDDAGAGFASLRHILALRPDIIKLDLALTSNIDHDPVRQALASALVGFAAGLRATLVAEGVETQGELDQLLRLGVDCAQGYFLARPAPLPLPPIAVRPLARLSQDAAAPDPLTAVAQETADAVDFASFIAPVLAAVVAVTGLDGSYLSLRRGDTLVRTHVHSTPRFAVPEGSTYPWHGSLCQQCHAAGMLWTADVPRDLVRGPHDTAVVSFLSVPVLSAAGEVLGTVCAVGVEPRYLSDRAVAQVRLLARLVAERLAREPAALSEV